MVRKAGTSKQTIRKIQGLAYSTPKGRACVGDVVTLFSSPSFRRFRRKAQLIFTSPPFPLVTKKRYGNLDGEAYIDWLSDTIGHCLPLLCEDGSIVIEMGNAWCRGIPTMSTLPLKALLAVQERHDLYLCQEIVWHNPARLPGPAQWVNIERVRLKDSFSRFWWLSKSPRPKANNRSVLTPYSDRMVSLLADKRSTSGSRPSQHKIGRKGFFNDNGGAISPNVLVYPNTTSADPYLAYCQDNDLSPHPARMPVSLAEFFIRFMTNQGDLVVDPFAGSNITGRAAENERRRWLSVEIDKDYVRGSLGRFNGEVRSLHIKRRRRRADTANSQGSKQAPKRATRKAS